MESPGVTDMISLMLDMGILSSLPAISDPRRIAAGRVGTDVPEALAKQDDATVFAALALDGALLLTVPFPPKLHD
jgi:hypothetical protein